jgi:hypothetical protein
MHLGICGEIIVGVSPMNDVSSSVVNSNIKRLQNLLETSVNEAERLTIQKLLAEEKLQGSLQASSTPK